jgi:hypothetical protein
LSSDAVRRLEDLCQRATKPVGKSSAPVASTITCTERSRIERRGSDRHDGSTLPEPSLPTPTEPAGGQTIWPAAAFAATLSVEQDQAGSKRGLEVLMAGGLGSGRRPKPGRKTVDSCPLVLDMGYLAARGWLAPGSSGVYPCSLGSGPNSATMLIRLCSGTDHLCLSWRFANIGIKNCFFVNQAGGAWDLEWMTLLEGRHLRWRGSRVGGATSPAGRGPLAVWPAAPRGRKRCSYEAAARTTAAIFMRCPTHQPRRVSRSMPLRGSRDAQAAGVKARVAQQCGAPSRPGHSHPGHTLGGLSRDK